MSWLDDFTVIFYQFNGSLGKNSIHFLQKKSYLPQTFEWQRVVYMLAHLTPHSPSALTLHSLCIKNIALQDLWVSFPCYSYETSCPPTLTLNVIHNVRNSHYLTLIRNVNAQ